MVEKQAVPHIHIVLQQHRNILFQRASEDGVQAIRRIFQRTRNGKNMNFVAKSAQCACQLIAIQICAADFRHKKGGNQANSHGDYRQYHARSVANFRPESRWMRECGFSIATQ